MAGDEDGNAVFAVGAADGSLRAGAADLAGEPFVGAGLARRNGPKRPPDRFLKGGARRHDRNGERRAASAEVRLELAGKPIEMGVRSRHQCRGQPPPERRHLTPQRRAIGEFQQAHTPGGGAGHERPHRAVDPCCLDAVDAVAAARRRAEGALEGVAEAARRLEAVAKADGKRVLAPPQLLEGKPHPAGAVIRLKRHAEVPAKVTPDSVRVDAQPPQVFVRCPIGVWGLHEVKEGVEPLRRLTVGDQRPATPAGPKAIEKTFADRGVEPDVPLERFPGAAGGAAEDPRRFDADVEDPVIGGIAVHRGPHHLVVTGQRLDHGNSLTAPQHDDPPIFERRCRKYDDLVNHGTRPGYRQRALAPRCH